MRKLQFGLIGLFLTLTLIACSSDEENGAESEENDSVTEEENNENTEEKVDNESSDSDANDKGNEEDSTDDSGKILSLGETGTVESNIGDYEITINSFEYMDEFEGEQTLLDYFVLVNFTVENIDNEPILGEDIYRADLFDDQEFLSGNRFFDSLNKLEGEIAPNESVESELIFDVEESEYYQVVFNFGSLEQNATTLTWEFDSDEVSN